MVKIVKHSVGDGLHEAGIVFGDASGNVVQLEVEEIAVARTFFRLLLRRLFAQQTRRSWNNLALESAPWRALCASIEFFLEMSRLIFAN